MLVLPFISYLRPSFLLAKVAANMWVENATNMTGGFLKWEKSVD